MRHILDAERDPDEHVWTLQSHPIDGIVNFTLPLAVPGGGTGMDLRADQDEPMVHVPYRPGVVLFTDRELLHRIGASVSNGPTDCRLTLQGHGVRYRDQLLLFW